MRAHVSGDGDLAPGLARQLPGRVIEAAVEGGRAAEVLVEGDSFRVIRRRETIRDLLAAELPEA